MTDSSYTLKEMVTKVIEQNEATIIQLTKLSGHAESVDSHLESLNSKVATNVKKISASWSAAATASTFTLKMMMF